MGGGSDDDADASDGVFQHWAAYNIAPDWTGLIEGYGPETGRKRWREVAFSKRSTTSTSPGRSLSPTWRESTCVSFPLAALRTVLDDAGPGATCDEIKRLAAPYEIAFVEVGGPRR
jgi:hypothetical protein